MKKKKANKTDFENEKDKQRDTGYITNNQKSSNMAQRRKQTTKQIHRQMDKKIKQQSSIDALYK